MNKIFCHFLTAINFPMPTVDYEFVTAIARTLKTLVRKTLKNTIFTAPASFYVSWACMPPSHVFYLDMSR